VISRKSFDLPKLGEPFGIMKAFTKRFPLGQYSQTVAEAAAQLRSFFVNTNEIHESTSGSLGMLSRSWLTAPINGGRKATRPPTTACRTRRPWC
jgi:hypothetical protein